jgi:CHAT domain-containing protein
MENNINYGTLLQSEILEKIKKLDREGSYFEMLSTIYPIVTLEEKELLHFPSDDRNLVIECAIKAVFNELSSESVNLLYENETDFSMPNMLVETMVYILPIILANSVDKFSALLERLGFTYNANKQKGLRNNNEIIKRIAETLDRNTFQNEDFRFALQSEYEFSKKVNDSMIAFSKIVSYEFTPLNITTIGEISDELVKRLVCFEPDGSEELAKSYIKLMNIIQNNPELCEDKSSQIMKTASLEVIKHFKELQPSFVFCMGGIPATITNCMKMEWLGEDEAIELLIKAHKILVSAKNNSQSGFKESPIGFYKIYLQAILLSAQIIIHAKQVDFNLCFDTAVDSLWYYNDALLQYAVFLDNEIGHLLKDIDSYFQYITAQILALFAKFDQNMPRGENVEIVERYFESLYFRKNITFYAEYWRKHNVTLEERKRLLEEPPSLEKIKNVLSDDEILLNYESILAWRRHNPPQKEDFALVVFAVSKNNPTLISYNNFKGDEDKDTLMAAETTQEVLENIDNSMKRLVICPSSYGCNFKFTGLPHKEEGRFLIDYFAIRQISNVYELANPRTKQKLNNALAVCPVTYKDSEKFKTLPEAESECDYIYRELQNSASIRRKLNYIKMAQSEATRSKLISKLKENNYDVVHIATHGDVDIDGRLYLVLASDDGKKDSLLYDNELAELVKKTNLAVFSLCYGGKMSEKAQDCLSGFVRAVLLSGTTSVIAPVEKVDSKATAAIFDIFYRKWFVDNETKPLEVIWQETIENFRKIVIDKDDDGHPLPFKIDYNEPQYWSPWIIYSAE